MKKEQQFRIIIDSNIPLADKAFSDFGPVEILESRNINRKAIEQADILLARSTIKIGKELLDGSPVKFVATATIGTDHVDQEYLRQNNIGFASAPGSNANSVAEYVIAALLYCAKKHNRHLQNMTLGIIGVGNVGSRVFKLAQALGITCLLNDPPKQRAFKNELFVSLEKVIEQSDIISLHVPLTQGGSEPTDNLVNELFISHMKKDAILINTSRGKVVNEAGLKKLRNRLSAVVLDVWENEPKVNPASVGLADIATPHIAGHSYDGKLNGTRMIYEAACAFYFKEAKDVFSKELNIHPTVIDLSGSSNPVFDAVMQAYPIINDDARFRQLMEKPEAERAIQFNEFRQDYPKRFEFHHFRIKGAGKELQQLADLGFQVRDR
jgi:erythronate-4-phosphate dehydrogenase